MKGWLKAFWVLMLPGAVVFADVLADGPLLIRRSNGVVFEGFLVHQETDGWMFSVRLPDSPEVAVRLGVGEVQSLRFPGEEVLAEAIEVLDAGDSARAAEMMRRVYAQRSPFLQVLGDDELRVLAEGSKALLESGDAAQCLAWLRQLLRHLDDPEVAGAFASMELRCLLHLGLLREGQPLARQLIEAGQDPDGIAVAWLVVGLHAFASGQFRDAWLASVHPLVRESGVRAQDRAALLVLASVASWEMGAVDQSVRYRESLRGMGAFPGVSDGVLPLLERMQWIHADAKPLPAPSVSFFRWDGVPGGTLSSEVIPVPKIPLIQSIESQP
jgi:hypothetical protein